MPGSGGVKQPLLYLRQTGCQEEGLLQVELKMKTGKLLQSFLIFGFYVPFIILCLMHLNYVM